MPTDGSSHTSRAVSLVSSPILVIALGSWEQHGPHLPLDTDTRIAEELVGRLVRRLDDAVRGPTIGVSASGEHAGFAGTLSIGGPIVTETVIELVRSADWASGVVIVNGHGGNVECLEDARVRLTTEGRRLLTWSPPLVDVRDSHAGYVETSLMLAIDPDAVRIADMAGGPTAPLGDIIGELRRGGVISVSPNGVLGDPRGATAARGLELLETWEELLVHHVESWSASLRGPER
jgi:mycofactocin precursor peptide peptidase